MTSLDRVKFGANLGDEKWELREKIFLPGIKAMKKFNSLSERAKYMSDELSDKETGYWGSFIREESVADENRAEP